MQWLQFMNALDILRADHTRFRSLMPRLYDDSVAAEERTNLREELEKLLKMHALIEEEIFYPAYKDATSDRSDREMYYESIEEHHVIDMLLPELMPMNPESEGFRAKAKVLKELVEHHAGEEEDDFFPRAEQLLGPAKLDELGRQMLERKNDLEQKWSTTMGAALRKAQTVAEKFAPTAMKDARVDANREG